MIDEPVGVVDPVLLGAEVKLRAERLFVEPAPVDRLGATLVALDDLVYAHMPPSAGVVIDDLDPHFAPAKVGDVPRGPVEPLAVAASRRADGLAVRQQVDARLALVPAFKRWASANQRRKSRIFSTSGWFALCVFSTEVPMASSTSRARRMRKCSRMRYWVAFIA